MKHWAKEISVLFVGAIIVACSGFIVSHYTSNPKIIALIMIAVAVPVVMIDDLPKIVRYLSRKS